MTLQMCEEAAMTAIALQTEQRRCRPRPLDPDVLSAAIPAYFIGRNSAGLWVAREVDGPLGGLFLFKGSAVDFARRRSAPARCALVFPTETFELDVKNRGNPLIRMAQAIRRRLRRPTAGSQT